MIADVEIARMLIESARYPTRATVDIRMLVKALRTEHARANELERALAALHGSDKMIDDAVFAAIGQHNLIMAQAVRVVCERMTAAEQALAVARKAEVEYVEGLNILAHEPGGEWHKRVAARSLERAATVKSAADHSDKREQDE